MVVDPAAFLAPDDPHAFDDQRDDPERTLSTLWDTRVVLIVSAGSLGSYSTVVGLKHRNLGLRDESILAGLEEIGRGVEDVAGTGKVRDLELQISSQLFS